MMMQKVDNDGWELIHSFTPTADIPAGGFWQDDINNIPDIEAINYATWLKTYCVDGTYGKYMTSDTTYIYTRSDSASQDWGDEWKVWIKVDLYKVLSLPRNEAYFVDFGSVQNTGSYNKSFGIGGFNHNSVGFNLKLYGNGSNPANNRIEIPTCNAGNPIAEITLVVYTENGKTGVKAEVKNGEYVYTKDWGTYLNVLTGKLPFKGNWYLNRGVVGGYDGQTDQYGLKIWRKRNV